MKKSAALLLILLMMLPMVGSAQDVELTETYADDLFSFNYPAGWFATRDNDDTIVRVTNFEPRDSMQIVDLQPGEVILNFSYLSDEEAPTLPANASDDFIMGYNFALFSLGATFFFEDAGGIEVGDVALIEFEGFDAAALTFKADNAYEGVIYGVSGEEPIFIGLYHSAGESTQWQDIAEAVIDTLQIQ